MAWGALLQAIPYLYQLGQAESQKSKARSMMASNKRPLMTTPQELKNNLALAIEAKNRASIMGMPGENVTANRIMQESQNNFNNMLNVGQDSPSVIAGLAALDQNQKDAFVDLGVKGAEYKLDAEKAANAGVMNANTALSNQELNEFDYNKNQPYQANAAAASALEGAGNQNENTAITGLANTAAYAVANAADNGDTGRMAGGAPVINAAPIAQPKPIDAGVVADTRTVVPPSQPYTARTLQPASPQPPAAQPNALRVENTGPLQSNDAGLLAVMKRYPNVSMQQLQKLYPWLFK
jgi:hypothetical protein